ncbi:MAG TPA: penicillin-binding transpeptidase domain-containing protein [Kofleriaceae bacterium]|nr:penicillin-binding transpeptidase domain-containing protein [Kofleriaceae bacterium]
MTPGVPRAARVRAYLTGLVIAVGLGGVAMRAWALQVDDGERYRALADRQHASRVEIPAPRGDVLDAQGRPLAVSADAESIWANPREVRDVAATADQLAALLGGDAQLLEAKLGGDHKFVWIERHVAPEVARRVRDAKLAGIEVAREPRRWYPARSLAGAVIGRADIDGNGVDGIELAMNDMLTGRASATRALRDARGRTMLAEGLADAEPGATVHLSIDRSIQAMTEDALATAVTSNQAKSGVAVVLEVGTGRVLAAASTPAYDPNDASERATGRDRAVVDAYEPGSVMKIFSVAAALDAGVVTPDTEFEIKGELRIGPNVVHDHEFDAYLTVGGIIKRSSNVGAAKIALRLGRDKLHDGLARFGFGAKTGVELPGERSGNLREAAHWRDIDVASIAHGIGITVTPLQVAAAVAAIGDHGMYRAPHVVDSVIDGDGTVLYRPESPARRVVSEQTAQQMMTMLESVFDKGPQPGTASELHVDGYRCAGKTGTAHKYDAETKTYANDRYLASFAGLAPADHPRIAVVVMVDEPSGADYYGGKVAGPVFATVASAALKYLGVRGEGAGLQASGFRPEAEAAGSFIGLGMAKAIEVAREKHVAIEISGSGRVVAQEVGANGVVRLKLKM